MKKWEEPTIQQLNLSHTMAERNSDSTTLICYCTQKNGHLDDNATCGHLWIPVNKNGKCPVDGPVLPENVDIALCS